MMACAAGSARGSAEPAPSIVAGCEGAVLRASARRRGSRLAAARSAAALIFLPAASEPRVEGDESREAVAGVKEDVASRFGETKLSASAPF